MAATTKYTLAATGSTGNNTGAAVVPALSYDDQIAIQFVVEVAGATPTVTWKAQGSLDGNNWYDLMYMTSSSDTGAATAITVTTVSAAVIWQDTANGARAYSQFRVVTSANTNVTYRAELYAFENR